MGRAKIQIEPIKNNKKRSITFHRRKDGIHKKARELSKLCDINVSMIIFSDYQETPQIFPPDHSKFERLINLYRQNSTVPGKIQSYGLPDYFKDRKNKNEDELSKAKKKAQEAMYPTWFDFLNDYSETQLRELSLMLGNKIDYVKRKNEIKKISKIQNLDCYPLYPVLDGQSNYLIPPLLNPNVGFYGDDQKNVMMMQSLNPNSVMKTMIMPLDYNNLGFDFGKLYGDGNNLITQSSNSDSMVKLLLNEDDGNGCYNYRENLNFSGQPPPPPEYFYPPGSDEYGFSPETMPPAFMHMN